VRKNKVTFHTQCHLLKQISVKNGALVLSYPIKLTGYRAIHIALNRSETLSK